MLFVIAANKVSIVVRGYLMSKFQDLVLAGILLDKNEVPNQFKALMVVFSMHVCIWDFGINYQ